MEKIIKKNKGKSENYLRNVAVGEKNYILCYTNWSMIDSNAEWDSIKDEKMDNTREYKKIINNPINDMDTVIGQ